MLTNFSTNRTTQRIQFQNNNLLIVISMNFIILWFLMYFNCIDKKDWFIENILIFIFSVYVILSYKKFKFSDFSYFVIFLFLVIHIYGAMYAYTQNPIGEFFQNKYDLWRNPYDRVVHFSFGFLLAYPLQDYLMNKLKVKGKWQYILPCEIILSLACIFELIEWMVAAITTKETGETYVATQGDVWDAHKDIVLALIGAILTMTILYFYRKYKLQKRIV